MIEAQEPCFDPLFWEMDWLYNRFSTSVSANEAQASKLPKRMPDVRESRVEKIEAAKAEPRATCVTEIAAL